MRRNVLIVARKRTPYVASREQSPSFEALSSVRLERSDGSLRTGPGWRPHRIWARRVCGRTVRQAVAIGNPRSAGPSCGPAMRCFPVLANVWPFDGSMAHRPPRPREAAWPPVARAGRDPTPRSEPMARRMLIDASHPEETRVVVVDGTRLEEFDFETATRKPLKGNIYVAKVIRIEPSLQAAFVEYGGNRHGFLAFSEIHPDYYQIPVADRERLIAEQQRLAAEADEDHEPRRRGRVDRTDIEDARAENRAEPVVEETPTPEMAAADTPVEQSSETQVAEAAPVETFGAAEPAEDAPAADAPPAGPGPHPGPQAQA